MKAGNPFTEISLVGRAQKAFCLHARKATDYLAAIQQRIAKLVKKLELPSWAP